MALIRTLLQIELRRQRSRLMILMLLLVFFGFITGPDRFSFSGDFSFEAGVHTDGEVRNPVSSWMQLWQVLPAAGSNGFASLAALVVLITGAFRSREEWEDGRFQLLSMGDPGFYRIQLVRFAIPMSILVLFAVGLNLISGAGYQQEHPAGMDLFMKVMLVFWYWFVTLVPFLLAFALLLSSVNTAYFRDGDVRLLHMVKSLGALVCLAVMVQGILSLPGRLSPDFPGRWQVPFGESAQGPVVVELLGLSPLLTLTAAVAMIVLSARILEETEC